MRRVKKKKKSHEAYKRNETNKKLADRQQEKKGKEKRKEKKKREREREREGEKKKKKGEKLGVGVEKKAERKKRGREKRDDERSSLAIFFSLSALVCHIDYC